MAVGIDVDIRTYDWGTFYGDIKTGNFQMYSLAWVGINLPDIFRYERRGSMAVRFGLRVPTEGGMRVFR